ncbi:putative HNHc nuclease [Fusobacterium varium]|uniref:putative HNHc nuclease n=1 Tax=Fusobacterium varium TaxID=856 RepID=UPI0030D3ADC6
MNLELKEENGNINLYVPSNKNLKDIYNLITKLQKSEINVIKVDRLSLDQSKLIWCLCKEYGDLIGYEREEMRDVLENEFCNSREIEYFSISPHKPSACSMETATDFITFIIEHSIEQGYNLIIPEGKGEKRTYKHSRDICPDINKYVIACIRSKRCAVCGSYYDVTIHHYDTIGATTGTYEKDDGLQGRMISLCGECHTKAHNMTKKEFENKYHIYGVWLTPTIVADIKKIYLGHFKAFRIENYKKGC